MRYGSKEKCAMCNGEGVEYSILDHEPLEDARPCPYCNGKGTLLLVWFGFRAVTLRGLADPENVGLREQVGLETG